MAILVIAEHDNLKLRTFSLNTIDAASKIDSDIHVLVAGKISRKIFSYSSFSKHIW